MEKKLSSNSIGRIDEAIQRFVTAWEDLKRTWDHLDTPQALDKAFYDFVDIWLATDRAVDRETHALEYWNDPERKRRESGFGEADLSPSEWVHWRLRVEGLVGKPLALTYEQILALPSSTLVADFQCEESGRMDAFRWTGVPLATVLERAEPLPAARYVAVRVGSFVACQPLDTIRPEDPLLAYRMEGWSVSSQDGGPVRLVGASLPCYRQVKRVERMELVADDSVETSREIALKWIGLL